jgi:hypothetical protein
MDHKKVDLGVIEVDEVNLELIESHEPEIPRSEELIRKTDYHWISSPPLAPEGAKDDLLVVSWNKSIETIIAELTRLDRIKPKTSMFGFKGKAKEIEKRINAVRDSLSDVSTKQNLSELVEEVNEISTIIDDTSSGIQQAEQEALDEKEKEKQLEHWEQLVSKAKNRATELTPRLKKKKSQLSDLEKKLKKAEGVKAQQVGSDIETLNNEVSLLDMEHKEAIQTSKKKFEFTPPSKSLKPEGKGKSARAKGNVFVSSEQSRPRFKVVIPEEDLPEVGTLVSAESKRYLAISFVEDIPIGIKEAKRLKASLCCPREVIS